MTPQEHARKRAAERGTEAERQFWLAAQGAAPDPASARKTEEGPDLPEEAKSTALQPVPIGQDAIAVMEALLATVPEAGAEAWDSIITKIAEASDPSELDAPWRVEGMRDLKDIALDIRSIRQAPSDYESGWNFYLVVDAVRHDTGEKITTTTGSVSIVAQLLKAHALGWFPLFCVPRVADRPTKAGFLPMHLEMLKRPVHAKV